MKKGNRILKGIADGLFPSNLFKKPLDKVRITAALISWGIAVSFFTGLITIEQLIEVLKYAFNE